MSPERFPWGDVAALGALAAGLSLIDGLAGTMSARGAAPEWLPLVVRLSAAALAACAIAGFRDERTRGLASQLAIWMAIAGALGAAIWVAVVAAEAVRGEPRPLFSAAIDAEIDDDPVEALAAIAGSIQDGRVRLDGASTVQPLCDVLADASTASQLRALAALAQNYHAGMAHALSLALSRGQSSVRVLAATALAKLSQSYGARVDARAAHPPATTAQWVALGQSRLDFALSGLLNDDRRSTVLEQAEVAFAAALALDASVTSAQVGAAASRRARRTRPLVAIAPQPKPVSTFGQMRPVQ
ncbi:MAG: hypothetical protein KJS97_00080 [Alphaproteobacteria bacterium]|nr:hypothetical protein [Alphaproteobacteria bacterium]